MSDILLKFMNIWEVETHFKCPVVGAMLSVEKHKNILKKCGYDIKRMKPYEYHQQIMAKLYDENNVSVKVNNFIRNKARKLMSRIAGLPDQDIRALWKEHLETGNVGPMMYAVISYEDTGIDLLQDVFGEVHMQAHANMTEIFHVRQKQVQADENLAQQKKKITLKNEKFKTLVAARKSDARKISLLQTENLQLKKRISELENMFHPGKKPENAIHCLEQKIADREQDLKAEQEKIRIMEREKRSLQIDLFSSRSENELMRKQFQAMVTGFTFCTSIDCPNEDYCIKEACPQYKLCAKRVFMVGGITKMKSFYKDIIENAGGEFHYHDGYLKAGKANFEAKVKRCDMVLCPVNCNSHNACLRVKKLCNKHNKTVKFLNSSSLSAVSQALFIPENEAIVN
ncbi:MAG: DUF2325 domain-containing protein [Desulfobacula sp.]|uniref:DUF2325 domain-containing protein n=1 Tax=Desulfobacula sp. TaxID=2593537 RepID=UPI0025C2C53E|nr:DUF2325 domain-containing protein [Desulfobacula sp.]MCD4720855.1 DUF2325 domain-containing protein [Desulfobacula sp.]